MKRMVLKSKNGNEKVVLNLENGKGKFYMEGRKRGKRVKAEVVYDRYSQKVIKVKVAA